MMNCRPDVGRIVSMLNVPPTVVVILSKLKVVSSKLLPDGGIEVVVVVVAGVVAILFFMKFRFIVIFLKRLEYLFKYFLVFSKVVALVVVVVEVVVVFLRLGFFINFLPSLPTLNGFSVGLFTGFIAWILPFRKAGKFFWFCGKKNRAGLVVNVTVGFVDVDVVVQGLGEVDPNILSNADSLVVV